MPKKQVEQFSDSDSDSDNSLYESKPGSKVTSSTKKPAKVTKSKKAVKQESDNDSDDEIETETKSKSIKTSKPKIDTKTEKTYVDVNKIIHRKINTKGYTLVIVESPGKTKKIESILGTGYVVTSSFGHIMDLHPKKLSVDIDNDFNPEYHILTGTNKFQDKTKVVKDLIDKASKASKIIIASDKDREGEMIGWSLKVILGLDDNYERITFNAITKDEIKKAIKNPQKINDMMVDSQKARRVLDRLVGFMISPSLNQMMGMGKLSAGRVQSILVKVICEKEQEIAEFFTLENKSFFNVVSNVVINDTNMKCDLFTDLVIDEDDDEEEDNDKEEYNNDEEENEDGKFKKAKIVSYKNAEKLMNNITKSKFKVTDLTVRKSKRVPSAPYTTSTVQQDASTKLGFNVKRTMQSLQKLYEAGHTTYLRTDSVNLSDDALKQCEDFIKDNYGDDWYNRKNYVNKKKNTQEAHEAIRPVDISKKTVPSSNSIGADEQKVYQLVWKRTVASQMAPAEVDVYTIDIGISKEKNYIFRSSIEDIVFPGFLSVYGIDNSQDDKVKLQLKVPKKGDAVNIENVKCSEEYKNPPMRYTEAGLLKKMDPKNLNIGRPSTCAEIISTIQKRNYVEIKDVDGVEKKSRTLVWEPDTDIVTETKTVYLGREKKKFCPTNLGTEVVKVLNDNFPELMDYNFTASMEQELDEIAEGKKEWVECVSEFWKKLKPLLDNIDKKKKVERILGKNPDTGYDVIATMGFHGPMLTMARSDKKTENASAPIKPPLTLESITLKQALKILEYPKILGTVNKKIVELKTGKHGFYITHGDRSTNIPNDADIDPADIDLDTALQFLEDKQKHHEGKISKYLYYHKDGNIEYIINQGKFGENNRYLMIKDVTKKTAKPVFLPFPSDESLEELDFDRLRILIVEAKARRSKNKSVKSNSKGTNLKTTNFKTKAKAVKKN